jgi:hypothetical protein
MEIAFVAIMIKTAYVNSEKLTHSITNILKSAMV